MNTCLVCKRANSLQTDRLAHKQLASFDNSVVRYIDNVI